MTWLIAHVGAKAARIIMFAVVVIAVLLIMVGMARCSHNSVDEHVERTSISADAMANAAMSAVATIESHQAAEAEAERAVAATQGNVTNAQSTDAIRSAVIDGVCRSASHRNDPACKVR